MTVETSMPSWRVLGASVRGASHLHNGLPNQDALWIEARTDAVVAVVADGHGGARHFRSADGARLAVQAAQEVLFALVPAFTAAVRPQRAQLAAVELPQRIVGRWVELTRADLALRAFSDRELAEVQASEGADAAASVRADPLLAYGATVLAALAVPQALVIAQLGDGDVLLVDTAGHTARPVPRDERLFGSLTTSLCRPGAESDFRSVVLEGKDAYPALLLLSTDGYANSFCSDADYLKVGTDFLEFLRRDGAETVGRQLPAILEDASANGSGDDITLAILAGDIDAMEQVAPHPKAAVDTAVVRRELRRAELHIAHQRSIIAVLLVLLLGIFGWTQRARLLALWAPPETVRAPAIVEHPRGGDAGLVPAPDDGKGGKEVVSGGGKGSADSASTPGKTVKGGKKGATGKADQVSRGNGTASSPQVPGSGVRPDASAGTLTGIEGEGGVPLTSPLVPPK